MKNCRRLALGLALLLLSLLCSCKGKTESSAPEANGKEAVEIKEEANTEEQAAEKKEEKEAAGKPEEKKKETEKKEDKKAETEEAETESDIYTIMEGDVSLTVTPPEGFRVVESGKNYVSLMREEDGRDVDYYLYKTGRKDTEGVYFVEEYIPGQVEMYRNAGADLTPDIHTYEGSYSYTMVLLKLTWSGIYKEGVVIAWAPTEVPGTYLICEVDDGSYQGKSGWKNADLVDEELISYLNLPKKN